MMLRLRPAFNPDGPLQPAQDAADGGGVHRAEQGGAAGGAVKAVKWRASHMASLPRKWGEVERTTPPTYVGGSPCGDATK